MTDKAKEIIFTFGGEVISFCYSLFKIENDFFLINRFLYVDYSLV